MEPITVVVKISVSLLFNWLNLVFFKRLGLYCFSLARPADLPSRLVLSGKVSDSAHGEDHQLYIKQAGVVGVWGGRGGGTNFSFF